MTNAKYILFSIGIITTMISCSGTTNKISSGRLSNIIKYRINSYAGCCGCFATYFDIYERGVKQEEVIYKYNCYNPGMPTKFIFKYDENGELLYCDKFVATVTSDFEAPLTANEKYIFDLLDKNQVLSINGTTIKYSEVKGFRKPKEQETTHMFPLINGGAKVKVR